jgi:hypothetical protein
VGIGVFVVALNRFLVVLDGAVEFLGDLKGAADLEICLGALGSSATAYVSKVAVAGVILGINVDYFLILPDGSIEVFFGKKGVAEHAMGLRMVGIELDREFIVADAWREIRWKNFFLRGRLTCRCETCGQSMGQHTSRSGSAANWEASQSTLRQWRQINKAHIAHRSQRDRVSIRRKKRDGARIAELLAQDDLSRVDVENVIQCRFA